MNLLITQTKGALHTMSTIEVTPTIENANNTAPVVHQSDNYSAENYTLEVGWDAKELAKPEADRKKKAYPEGNFTEEDIAKGEWQVLYTQTFVHYVPSNLQGVSELVPDDDEVLNLICASLKVKLANRSRSLATQKDFTPQDNVIDFFDECNKKSEKRLTPFEKTKNEILNNMPKAAQQALLELLKAQLAQEATA